MGSELYIGASGAAARLRDLDIVANNLANASTVGFKRDTPVFEAVLQSSIRNATGKLQHGAPARSFVATDRVATDFAPGPVQRTGAPTDVAIAGEGFFEVETPRGLRYTRAGSFVVNADRLLATSEGHPVQGQGGPIAVGTGAVRIDSSGQITDAAGNALGRLKLVAFEARSLLRKDGGSLFQAMPGAAPEDVPDPRFDPESLEGSNVRSVQEMSTLVTLQRAFQTNLEAIRADDRATESLLREITR